MGNLTNMNGQYEMGNLTDECQAVLQVHYACEKHVAGDEDTADRSLLNK